ncbi:hypothetical protein E4U14_001417 [Claviceps sp. LM454 group G7]|nr:hypothetical protein E4U14_001417 [Claviceps sp. LM454 group G7]
MYFFIAPVFNKKPLKQIPSPTGVRCIRLTRTSHVEGSRGIPYKEWSTTNPRGPRI